MVGNNALAGEGDSVSNGNAPSTTRELYVNSAYSPCFLSGVVYPFYLSRNVVFTKYEGGPCFLKMVSSTAVTPCHHLINKREFLCLSMLV